MAQETTDVVFQSQDLMLTRIRENSTPHANSYVADDKFEKIIEGLPTKLLDAPQILLLDLQWGLHKYGCYIL